MTSDTNQWKPNRTNIEEDVVKMEADDSDRQQFMCGIKFDHFKDYILCSITEIFRIFQQSPHASICGIKNKCERLPL